MSKSTEITDDAILRLLATANAVPKPIGQMVRSGEGGEHMVWIIDDAFVLRLRADGLDGGLLIQEKALWGVLKSVEPGFTAMPTCLGVGTWDDGRRPYGLYRKLAGVSIEDSPQSVNAATEDDLVELLKLLKKTPIEKVRAIGVVDAEPVDLLERRRLALEAWRVRLRDNGHLGRLTDVDIAQALHISDTAVNGPYTPVLLHADLKGEHIFVDPATGRLTGVIDWSDACIGHPSVDVRGLTISVGAAASARIAARAGYGGDVVARGTWTACCEAVLCLDAIVRGEDDSPEWLIRRQLRRALEKVEGEE
ncbi:transferase [Cordyceps fumosorosea ARSEF 2679]|uniref:Transferase n=1 Tax=Cordyceps fumosorosea (strain ARSEF 2679) TaxID=1081104 RepID=A0A167QL42_CORFA|nr:transferase [Cordyceps fumosorosea ARSEF 2679]OAA57738.1 transferase [Cordyceps fumosorosea ARSEF 2679]